MKKYWIQKVTKHKGNLKKWAKEHHFTNKNGTINITKGLRYAKNKHLDKRIKQLNLAKTLKKLRK